MDDTCPDTTQNIEISESDRPVVGVRISPNTRSDAVAGAILRAQRAGHQVIVAHEGLANVEAIEFAQDLGGMVLNSGAKQTNDGTLLNEVTRVARVAEFPGLIWQEDPAQNVDYERSVNAFAERSEYVIDARQKHSVGSEQGRSQSQVQSNPLPRSEGGEPSTMEGDPTEEVPKGEKMSEGDKPAPNGGKMVTQKAVAEKTDLQQEEPLLPADSEQQPNISVVLPTLNEADGIATCITHVKNALAELGLYGEVIVSDSSTDETPDIAREMGAIVVHPDEAGYGSAYRFAFEHVRGEYVVIGDADCTYDFEDLPKLLEPVENGADICLGSRLDGKIEPGAMSALHRYIGNPLLTKFLNLFYDVDVSDAHSGFRVIHRDALVDLELETDGMEFASEMLMEASRRDLTIKEVPIVYHEREGDATLDSFRDGWRHVRFMLLNAPGYLFSGPGILMGGVGVLLMLLALFNVTLKGWELGIHSLVAGSLLTIVGTQVASFGAFAGLASDPIRGPSDPITGYIESHVQLEHGATAGLLLVGAGAGYSIIMVGRWVVSGFTRLSYLPADIVAMTAIVLGLQIVFSSFFLSVIASSEG